MRGKRNRRAGIGRSLAGVIRQSECPKSVGVSAAVALGGKSQSAADTVGALDFMQVGDNVGVVGDSDLAFFETLFKRVCHKLLCGLGKANGLDSRRAVARKGAFGELASDARVVDARAAQGFVGKVGVQV